MLNAALVTYMQTSMKAVGAALNSLSTIAAENSTSAPVSALVWWVIPITALLGGLGYAFWVTRLKTKFDNQTERSVGRFQKFQKSFNNIDETRTDQEDLKDWKRVIES